MKHKQSGFAALELVIVLVVIALVGGIGWYVLGRTKQPAKQTATQSAPKAEITYKTFKAYSEGTQFSYPATLGTVNMESNNSQTIRFYYENGDPSPQYQISRKSKGDFYKDADSPLANIVGYSYENGAGTTLYLEIAGGKKEAISKENVLYEGKTRGDGVIVTGGAISTFILGIKDYPTGIVLFSHPGELYESKSSPSKQYIVDTIKHMMQSFQGRVPALDETTN